MLQNQSVKCFEILYWFQHVRLHETHHDASSFVKIDNKQKKKKPQENVKGLEEKNKNKKKTFIGSILECDQVYSIKNAQNLFCKQFHLFKKPWDVQK